jgi:hypothetical protein
VSHIKKDLWYTGSILLDIPINALHIQRYKDSQLEAADQYMLYN